MNGNLCTPSNQDSMISENKFKYLKFNKLNDEHIISLVDDKGFEVSRGFGNTLIDAINDLHSCLV